MSYSKLDLVLCISLILVLINGCVENNIVPISGNLKVHVYDDMNCPFSDVYLTTGKYPLVIPDGNGNAFLNSSLPCYLCVQINPNSNFEIFDKIYKNEISIVLPFEFGHGFDKIKVSISFPKVQYSQLGLFTFISKTPFQGSGSNYFTYYNTTALCNIDFSSVLNEFDCKMVLLIATVDDYTGNIISYDNYGEKDIRLYKDSVQNIVISQNDFKLKPGQAGFMYNVHWPNNYQEAFSFIYLIYDDYYSGPDMYLPIHNSSEDILVPTCLPLNYNIKLYGEAFLKDYDVSKWIFAKPGESVSLDISKVPGIFLPVDDAENISDTSVFYYDDDFSKGIYSLYFWFNETTQNFITDKNKITLGELKRAGLNFYPNSLYFWSFEKYSEFNSIDDFLSQPYLSNIKYNSNVYSASRIFRTSP